MLQHVPVGHRLGVCATVSSTWHAAAITATNSIVVHRPSWNASDDKAPGFCTAKLLTLPSWLQKHSAAAQLSTLDIQYRSCNPDNCSSLSIALGAVLPAVEHLTALILSGPWQEAVLEHLSSLQHLQDLVLGFDNDVLLTHIIETMPVTLTSLVLMTTPSPIMEAPTPYITSQTCSVCGSAGAVPASALQRLHSCYSYAPSSCIPLVSAQALPPTALCQSWRV